ncbi:hypothetical protein Bbelb_105560 [Branchiostoma belcheri]|nr:hypothetical protein Bbelb_105560 [Branchiostoma belcheri]
MSELRIPGGMLKSRPESTGGAGLCARPDNSLASRLEPAPPREPGTTRLLQESSFPEFSCQSVHTGKSYSAETIEGLINISLSAFCYAEISQKQSDTVPHESSALVAFSYEFFIRGFKVTLKTIFQEVPRREDETVRFDRTHIGKAAKGP